MRRLQKPMPSVNHLFGMNPGMKRKSNQKGMTLVELLIAAAISAVIGTVIVATFDSSIKIWQKFKTRSFQDMGVMRFADLVDEDIRESWAVDSLSTYALILKIDSAFVYWEIDTAATAITLHRYESDTNGSWTKQPLDPHIVIPRKDSTLAISFLTSNNNVVTYQYSDGISTFVGRAVMRAPSQ